MSVSFIFVMYVVDGIPDYIALEEQSRHRSNINIV